MTPKDEIRYVIYVIIAGIILLAIFWPRDSHSAFEPISYGTLEYAKVTKIADTNATCYVLSTVNAAKTASNSIAISCVKN